MASATDTEVAKVISLEGAAKNHDANALSNLQKELHSIPPEMRSQVYQAVKDHDNGNTLIHESSSAGGTTYLNLDSNIYKSVSQTASDTGSGKSTSAADLGGRWQKDFESGNLNDPGLKKDLEEGARQAYEKGGQAGLTKFEKDLNDNIPAAGAGVQFDANADGDFSMRYVQDLKTEAGMFGAQEYKADLTKPEGFSIYDQKTENDAQDAIKLAKSNDPAATQKVADMMNAAYDKDPQGKGYDDAVNLLKHINQQAGHEVFHYSEAGVTMNGGDQGAKPHDIPIAPRS